VPSGNLRETQFAAGRIEWLQVNARWSEGRRAGEDLRCPSAAVAFAVVLAASRVGVLEVDWLTALSWPA
jgi:hypothetical protein